MKRWDLRRRIAQERVATEGAILLFGERYWGKPRQDESGSPRRSIQQGV